MGENSELSTRELTGILLLENCSSLLGNENGTQIFPTNQTACGGGKNETEGQSIFHFYRVSQIFSVNQKFHFIYTVKRFRI